MNPSGSSPNILTSIFLSKKLHRGFPAFEIILQKPNRGFPVFQIILYKPNRGLAGDFQIALQRAPSYML